MRVAFLGSGFGALAVLLMIARIEIAPGVFIDTRSAPIALLALFEGWPAALVAAAWAGGYRVWLGGPGTLAGLLALAATAAVGGLVHVWARADGGVRPRHAFTLGGAVYVVTFASFLLVGPYGAALFARVWLHVLAAYGLGLGLLARFLHEVVERERLREAQRRFRAVLDEATDAIRIVDPETWRILDSNRRDCDLAGYSREEMIGRDIREFWPDDPALRAEKARAVEEAHARGTAHTLGATYRRRSGELVRLDSTRKVVTHGGRRFEIVVYRDAAERLAVEAVRQEAAELRAATLVAGAAAHEINNPLAVVMSALELLGRSLPAGTRDALRAQRALGAAGRIREIVVRMRRLARVEAHPDGTQGLPPRLDLRRSTDVSDLAAKES